MSQCHLRQALVITERFMFSWLMKCVFKLFFWIQSPCSLYGNGGFWWENWFCEVDKNIRRWHLIVQRFILFKFYVFGHIFEPIEMLLYSLQMSRSFCFSKWGWYDFNWWSKLLRNINHTDNQPEAWDQKTHFRHDGCFEKFDIFWLKNQSSKRWKLFDYNAFITSKVLSGLETLELTEWPLVYSILFNLKISNFFSATYYLYRSPEYQWLCLHKSQRNSEWGN